MNLARPLMWVVLLTLAQLLDVGVLDRQPVLGPVVDLLLLVVVAAALSGGSVTGATVGLLAGLLADLTPPAAGLLGVNALAYGLGGALAGRWHRPGGRSGGRPLPLTLAAAAVAALAASAVHLLFGLGDERLGQAGLTAAMAAGAAVVVGAVVLPAVAALDRRVVSDLP
jgi:cell shape-determining protein MreD